MDTLHLGLWLVFTAVLSTASGYHHFGYPQPHFRPPLDLQEDDVCLRFNYKEWRCRRSQDCPQVGDLWRSRHPVCGYLPGGQPIVCCPPLPVAKTPPPPPLRAPLPRSGGIKQSKSDLYCERYLEICEDDYNGLNGPGPGPVRPLPDFWGPSPGYRWKRQVNYRPTGLIPSIVGGKPTVPTERPYMAVIGYGDVDKKEWNCGGSMVSEKFVLSAAHCAETRDLGVARWVRLGELDLSTTLDDEGLQDLVIVSRIVHPEYKWPAIYHDIALFKLRRGAVFTNWVRPVCLHNDPVIPVSTGVATGWGRTDFVGDTSPQLMEVELTLVEGEDCENLLGRSNGTRLPRGLDPEIMLCAGEKEGGKDTCSGDSGGPLVIQEVGKCLTTQVGITSFGRECGKPNSPGVYTRVSYYVPWIESIVWA